MDSQGFNQERIKYDWKTKIGAYLPDERSTVVSSILFMPLAKEHIEATTVRSMAWFSAAVSSGVPLVFVNIQTEQIINSVLFLNAHILHLASISLFQGSLIEPYWLQPQFYGHIVSTIFKIVALSFKFCPRNSETVLILYITVFFLKKRSNISATEITWIRQLKYTTEVQTLQGIRLWFLPGVAEVSFKLTPEKGETRFGMNISGTDEVILFIPCIW